MKIREFTTLTAVNLKLQFRQGFVAAWALITAFYLLGLYFLPQNLKEILLPLVLLSEPSTFAMIFTGAILLLERDEGLLDNLFITPLSIRSYFYAKALSLSLPAAVSGLVLALALAPLSWNLLLIIPSVILTTLFFSLLTFIPASSSKDIMGLIGKIGIYGTPFSLSILDYFGIASGYHHYLLPGKGTLVLMSSAAEGKFPETVPFLLAFLSLILGIILITGPAEKSFRRNIIEKGGLR